MSTIEQIYRKWEKDIEIDVRHEVWISEDEWMQQATLFCLTNRLHRLADKVQYNLLTKTLPRMLPSLFADVLNHFKITASTVREQGVYYLVISEECSQKLYRFTSPYYYLSQIQHLEGSNAPRASEEVLVWMGKEDCSRFKDYITDAVEYHGKQWMTISEFLTALIGGKEAKEILGYFAETTRMLINKVLDIMTVPIPTKRALGKFSSIAINKIKNEDIPEVMKLLKDSGITNDQLATLKINLLERNRLQALFGENDFSQSFSASEWRVYYSDVGEALEQTGVVVGYIKAVEQLLWSVFSLSQAKPLYISLRFGTSVNGYKPYPVTKELLSSRERDITLATFGHSVRLVEENSGLFEVDKAVQKKLADKILDFSKGTRCKLMHRDNLSNEEVSIIRSDAITILCLILGAVHLTDSQEKELVRFNMANLALNESLAEIREELNRFVIAAAQIRHDASMLYACMDSAGVWTITLFYQLNRKDVYQSGNIPYQPLSSMSPIDAQKVLASYLEGYLNCSELGKQLSQNGCRLVVKIPNAPAIDRMIMHS